MNSDNRKTDKGLPPGTLTYIGPQRTGKVSIEIYLYDKKHFEKIETIDPTEKFLQKNLKTNKNSVLWVNVNGIHDTAVLRQIGDIFNIHALALEDILNTNQRPKIEEIADYLFLSLKMLRLNPKKNIIHEHISLIIGKNYVISFQEESGDVFQVLRSRIENNKGIIRKMKSDYLAYALIDSIVDNYFVILENIDEQINLIENKVIHNNYQNTLQEIHRLKRSIILFKKHVWPVREIISYLEKNDSDIISNKIAHYLRDVYEHTIQVIDTIESFKDMAGSLTDLYLTVSGNKMNEIMKVLTIIATLFIPLTFLAGIYGMNFKYMPELDVKWGYPALIIIMILIITAMLYFFKRKKWL